MKVASKRVNGGDGGFRGDGNGGERSGGSTCGTGGEPSSQWKIPQFRGGGFLSGLSLDFLPERHSCAGGGNEEDCAVEEWTDDREQAGCADTHFPVAEAGVPENSSEQDQKYVFLSSREYLPANTSFPSRGVNI